MDAKDSQGRAMANTPLWLVVSCQTTTDGRTCKKLWEELIACLPFTAYYVFDRHILYRRHCISYAVVVCVFVAAGTCLLSLCLTIIGGIHRQQGDLISLLFSTPYLTSWS
jgi:hypothetical protein